MAALFYTPGVSEITKTSGQDDYVLAGALAPDASFEQKVPDRSIVNFSVTNGSLKEVGSGVFDLNSNSVSRVVISFPADGIKVNWGNGNKIIILEVGGNIGAYAPVQSVGGMTGHVDIVALAVDITDDLAAIEALGGTGIAVRTGTNTWAQRVILGTSNRLSVTNGDGVSGDPTLNIDVAYAGQASITTLGTITSGTWSATTIAVNKGGTGQTSYTNGQLLIGNTSGNTLTKATLTAPAAGISITNSTGSITFGLGNDLAALEGLSSIGFATRTTTDTWAQRTITGTSNRLSVTNGDGVSGNPTLDISSSYVGQASITTVGTVATGVWNGTAVGLAYGGTATDLSAQGTTWDEVLYWELADNIGVDDGNLSDSEFLPSLDEGDWGGLLTDSTTAGFITGDEGIIN